MSQLAGLPFFKMNGIGNEIIVLDLRGTGAVVSPADARAINADPALAFDQLMILSQPRSAETDAFMTILNNDGSESGARLSRASRIFHETHLPPSPSLYCSAYMTA